MKFKYSCNRYLDTSSHAYCCTILWSVAFKFFGIVVGASAVALAVTAEALYAQLAVRSILKNKMALQTKSFVVNRKQFTSFYLPLAITPLASLLIHPAGSAGMSRMPDALSSLAAWPVVYGLVFITRSLGFAYNEVVVALLDKPNGKYMLLKFTRILAVTTVSFLVILALSPLGYYWLKVSLDFQKNCPIYQPQPFCLLS